MQELHGCRFIGIATHRGGHTTRRNYIHTAGPGSYVDEYICETDRFDVPLYHLQDANYNVVGLLISARL
jgi:hypothetical protein